MNLSVARAIDTRLDVAMRSIAIMLGDIVGSASLGAGIGKFLFSHVASAGLSLSRLKQWLHAGKQVLPLAPKACSN